MPAPRRRAARAGAASWNVVTPGSPLAVAAGAHRARRDVQADKEARAACFVFAFISASGATGSLVLMDGNRRPAPIVVCIDRCDHLAGVQLLELLYYPNLVSTVGDRAVLAMCMLEMSCVPASPEFALGFGKGLPAQPRPSMALMVGASTHER